MIAKVFAIKIMPVDKNDVKFIIEIDTCKYNDDMIRFY